LNLRSWRLLCWVCFLFFCFLGWGVVCLLFVFVGCVVSIWIAVIVFLVVLVASVGSLLLDRVRLFGSFSFAFRVFTFCIFGGDCCFPFILCFGCGMV